MVLKVGHIVVEEVFASNIVGSALNLAKKCFCDWNSIHQRIVVGTRLKDVAGFPEEQGLATTAELFRFNPSFDNADNLGDDMFLDYVAQELCVNPLKLSMASNVKKVVRDRYRLKQVVKKFKVFPR